MASTTDLQNPIYWPNGHDTANNNPIVRSDKVTRQGLGKNVETTLVGLESTQIAYTFNTAVTDTTDPGSGFMALNNTDKDAATIATFSTTSANNSARFDEVLNNLTTGDRIYLQERDNPGTNILYRITGATTLTGTRVNVPVVREQDQGTALGTFTNSGAVVMTILFTRTVSASGLPQPQADWLAQTSSQQLTTTTVTNIAPTVTDVLLWRRSAIVQQAGIGNPGTGLVIAEANRQSDGTFDRASGTSVYDDDLANAYIYIGITASDFTNLTLNATFLEARRAGELVFSASLESLVDAEAVDGITTGQFSYRRTTNIQYNYVTGDVLTVVTRATSQTTEYNYNSPAGDFTANIDDLSFSAVDADFTARVSGTSDNQEINAADRVRLTGLLVSTNTTAEGPITVLYKEGAPTVNAADYDKTWNAANPVLANFGTTRILSILVTNNVTVTAISGGATLGPQLSWLPGNYIYQVTLPAEVNVDGTVTSHLPSGTTSTFLPTGFNDNYKIFRANVAANLLAAIDAHGGSADISSLETKVAELFPLTPDVPILINWANIYDPIHGAATVDIVDGYSLIAAYKSDTERYESVGVTYGTGVDVISYTGLSENLHRSFGFALTQVNTVTLTGTSGTANIPVGGVDYLATFNTNLTTTASDFVTTHNVALDTAGVTVTSSAAVLTFTSTDPSVPFTITDAVNATGNLAGTEASVLTDKTLLWIVDGAETIPFVDVTASGTIRVNNYTPATTTSQEISNQATFLTKQSGPATISQGSGNQVFAIPNFPSGSTNRSRTLQIDPDIFVNGVDTLAGGVNPIVDIPATNTAEALDTVEHAFNLGPLHGNRIVNITTGYEFIVDGADLDVRLTVVSAPSDVSVNYEGGTVALLNYTAQNTVARVDNFLTASDGAGTYTFTGWQEFILSARPAIGRDGNPTGIVEMVPAAVGANGVISQLNDVNVRTPTPLWTDIEVADDIGFKTFVADHYFRHSEIAGLLLHRTEKWAYGLARLQTINAGHRFTQAVDLATGSTIGGSPIGPGTVQAELVVYEATGKGTGVGELVSSVVLPANYATYRYVHVTEYDVTNLQFRHAEFPTYILSAGLVDANDNVRLQGNSFLRWTAGTRTLDFNPTAQEILRVTLKD